MQDQSRRLQLKESWKAEERWEKEEVHCPHIFLKGLLFYLTVLISILPFFVKSTVQLQFVVIIGFCLNAKASRSNNFM